MASTLGQKAKLQCDHRWIRRLGSNLIETMEGISLIPHCLSSQPRRQLEELQIVPKIWVTLRIHPGKLLECIMTTKRWFDRGGMLISTTFMTCELITSVGYSQFRTLLNSKVRSEEDAAVLNKRLLEGPDNVIADEAHEIKNEKSTIGKLLAGVKTTSRIALTGSPLSNHLQEYWAMMDWIHPGFLGSLRGFTTNYITPIKDGLYRDSLGEERKFSQKGLLLSGSSVSVRKF